MIFGQRREIEMKRLAICILGLSVCGVAGAHSSLGDSNHNTYQCNLDDLMNTWKVFLPGDNSDQLPVDATLEIARESDGSFQIELTGTDWRYSGGHIDSSCQNSPRLEIPVTNGQVHYTLCIDRVVSVFDLVARPDGTTNVNQLGTLVVPKKNDCWAEEGVMGMTPGHAHADD